MRKKIEKSKEKEREIKKKTETKSEKLDADEGAVRDRKERKTAGGGDYRVSILNPFHLYPIYDLAPDNPVTLC